MSPSPSRHIHAYASSVGRIDRITPLNDGDLPPPYEAERGQRVRRQLRQRWETDMSPTRMTVPLRLATASPPISPAPLGVRSSNGENQASANMHERSLDEVSREAIEKWKSLKRELGFECQVIDRALLARVPTPSPSPTRDDVDLTSNPLPPEVEQRMRTLTPRLAREWADRVRAAADAEDDEQADKDNQMDENRMPRSPAKRQRSPKWRFYNVYNSVFYPTTEKEDSPKRDWNVTLTSVGVWALVFMTGESF